MAAHIQSVSDALHLGVVAIGLALYAIGAVVTFLAWLCTGPKWEPADA
jgi:hypothetical protein